MITVYYVRGIDPAGHVSDLAKFFDPLAARDHAATFSRAGVQTPFRDVGVVPVEEREEVQHAAHQAHPEHGPAAWSRPPRPQAPEPALAVITAHGEPGVTFEFTSAPIPPPPETKPEVLEEDALDLPPVFTAEEHESAGPEGS